MGNLCFPFLPHFSASSFLLQAPVLVCPLRHISVPVGPLSPCPVLLAQDSSFLLSSKSALSLRVTSAGAPSCLGSPHHRIPSSLLLFSPCAPQLSCFCSVCPEVSVKTCLSYPSSSCPFYLVNVRLVCEGPSVDTCGKVSGWLGGSSRAWHLPCILSHLAPHSLS